MPPRRYTTKIRAKRIALSYFKHLHPFRRWKRILSIAVPAVAAIWLLVDGARGDYHLYTSGPMSTAHAMFERDCQVCHGPGPAAPPTSLAPATRPGFFLRVSDNACRACHAGPVHHANEAFTPRCASCHLEHRDREQLVAIADRHCTQCHADLKTKDGAPPAFAPRIARLADHPEFAVTVREGDRAARARLDRPAEVRDTAQVKLNHAKHLKANLKGLEDVRRQRGMAGLTPVKDGLRLACTFCHQPDERGQSLQPVAYPRHCAACHPLDFDGRFADVVAPHDTPPIVHAFLRGTLGEAFDQCQAIPAGDAGRAGRARCVELELAKAPAEPEAPSEEPRGGRLRGRAAEPEPAPDTPRGGRLRGRAAEEEAPAPSGWVGAQMAAVEPGLFKQRCEYCHTVQRGRGPLPEIVPTAMPARWLPHARFDHGVHRTLTCVECHRATTSTETKDVLLPSITTCRECHRVAGGARTGCVECHRYHDKTRERDADGPFKVRQLLTGTGTRPDRRR